MTALSVLPPLPIFFDIDGQPLEDGYVWIGVNGLEPQANPQTAYWDAALTQVVTQPVRTRGGYPMNGSAIGILYTGSAYSVKVQNKRSSTIVTNLAGAAGVGVTSLSFGSTGLTPSVSTAGDVVVAGTLAGANGGTGITAPGSAGNVLTSNGTVWTSSPVVATPTLNIVTGAAFFTASGTWTAPYDGWAIFTAVGPGGSGAIAQNNGSADRRNATGGGAGGFALKKLYVARGSTYTVTMGAPGAAVTTSTVGIVATNGNAGGNTTITGPGLSLTANGGLGGQAGTTGTVAGGTGGTATGGDANVTGGTGGPISATGAFPAASGGGAVGANGTGYSGGAISGVNTNINATGGGGVGGAGGALVAAGAVSTGGGGSGGPGTQNASTSGPAIDGSTTVSDGVVPGTWTGSAFVGSFTMPTAGVALVGSGAVGGGSARLAAPGGGGGGSQTSNGTAGTGGLYGGGGAGAIDAGAGSALILGGPGGRGAGGGGAARSNFSGGSTTSGAGGGGYASVVMF